MTAELKQCPFCGGEADIEETSFMEHATFSVGCRNMDGPDECIGQQSLLTFARKSEAIAAWNRRAPMTALTPAAEEGERPDVVSRLHAEIVYARTRGHNGRAMLLEAAKAEIERLRSSPRVERARALEEAAKVAETRHVHWHMPHPDDAFPGEVKCDVTACADIAKAIRSLSPQGGQGNMNLATRGEDAATAPIP